MATLIIYGLIIAALIAGALSVRNSIENKGIEKQKGIDAPIIAAAKKAADEAKAANDGLAAERVRLIADRQACSDQVAALGKASDAKIAAAAKAKVAAETRAASLASDAAAFAAKSQQTTGASCDAQLQSVNDTLRELGARRVRDHGKADGGNDGGGAGTAPNQGAGAGALRIGQ